MAKYELNDIQINNALEFMRRVQLTGAEVPAWNEIIGALSSPIPETPVVQSETQSN